MKSPLAPPDGQVPFRVAAALVLGWVLFAIGCRPELETVYGMRAGYGAESVNGTAVFAELLERAGHQVTSRETISPTFEHANVVVWVPDRFECPEPQAVRWFEDWLRDEPNRMLIYVGRDYDAACCYWQHVLDDTDDTATSAVAAELATANRDFQSQRAAIANHSACNWFTLDDSAGPRKITSLEGPFRAGVDSKRTEIELFSRMIPRPDWPYEVLLESEGDLILGVHAVSAGSGESQLIVVANGSFLLNVPLVNHEHRKLASKLVAAVPPGEQRIVFLESGPDAVRIRSNEDLGGPPSTLSLLGVWPLSVIVAHLVVLGIVYAIARWPIFGQPRHLPPVVRSEFGKHVAAVGNLMAKTGDSGYARRAILRLYQALDNETPEHP